MPETEARKSPLRCYRCGASLAALSLPLARLDLCPDCSVELHVCRMCRHYAPSAPEGCDEDDAPEVRNKTAANFCDYFQPTPEAFDGRAQRAENKARAELEALFGGDAGAKPENGTEPGDDSLQRAEDLFRK